MHTAFNLGCVPSFLSSCPAAATAHACQVKLTGGRVPVLELCVVRSSISLCTSLSLGVASRIQPLLGHRCVCLLTCVGRCVF